MNQVSVGHSIAQAYGFLFRRIMTVLALSWVAALFFIVLRKALLGLGPFPHDVMAHVPEALMHLGGVIAAVLLLCAIAVPLTRAALGEAMDWSLAHFVIGAREVRLFAALVRLYLILIAVVVVCVLAVAGIAIGTKMALAQWPVLASTGLPVQTIMRGIAVIAAAAVTIYVSVRLSFLVYAIAAAEPQASLKRSWELAGGNVLRMLAIALAIAVPVYALFFVAEYALMGQALMDALHTLFAAGGTTQTPLYALLAAHGWSVATAAGVMIVALTALGAAASATAYRGLMGLDVVDAPVEVEEAVIEEIVQEAPTEHHAEPAEHHEAHGHADAAPAEEAVAGDASHGEEAHHAEPGHEATDEASHGDDDHGHMAPDDHAPAEGVHAVEHEAPAPVEDAHVEEAHGHAEDAHGEDAHAHAAEAAPDEAEAADTAHAEEPGEPHADETHAEAAHAEKAHTDAGHSEEGHVEVAQDDTEHAEAVPAEGGQHGEVHTHAAGGESHDLRREPEHA